MGSGSVVDTTRQIGGVPSNGALIEACRTGDQQAWSTIVSRYERLVYAIPLREGLDADLAAEVAQECFLALLTALDKIDDPGRLGYWLMTVARRLSWRARNRLRREQNSTEVPTDEPDERLPDDLETAWWVHEAVQSLGQPCRDLVIALFFDPAEPQYSEIAVKLGRPLGSIGPLRHRCLERLRRALEASAS
jgi:RNA polymerase sigma factor (sigma-70 family)